VGSLKSVFLLILMQPKADFDPVKLNIRKIKISIDLTTIKPANFDQHPFYTQQSAGTTS